MTLFNWLKNVRRGRISGRFGRRNSWRKLQEAGNGALLELVEHTESLEDRCLLAADFGDAPDTAAGTGAGNYETTTANGGPSHTTDVTLTTLFLGNSVDADSGSLQNAAANADDVDGTDDEDGVITRHDLVGTVGATPTISLYATNNTGSAATLYGWIDYDGDGEFESGTERASIAVPTGTTDGRFTLTFPTIPADSDGQTYARFRLSTDTAAADATGSASDGEVEDYKFLITNPASGFVSSVTIGDNLNGGPALDSGDIFGHSLGWIGDVDGDGIDDMVASASNDDTGGTDRGAAYVLFMNQNGTVRTHTKLANATNGFDSNLRDGDHFGGFTQAAPLGDLNGDGVPDFAIGAPDRDPGNVTRAGVVYVVMLNSDGTAQSTLQLENNVNGIPTIAAESRFGRGLADIGDLDGDGITELLVGMLDRAMVVFLDSAGGAKSTVELSSGNNGLPTLPSGNTFGFSATGLGDIDGDQIPDIAIGNRDNDSVGSGRGAVYVLQMNANGTVKASTKLGSGQNGIPALGDNTNFGRGVSSMGDLNGDGITDLAVDTLVGTTYLVHLDTDGSAKSSTAIPFGGTSVSFLGDLNRDGYPDLATNGGGSTGSVDIVFLGNEDFGDAPDTASGTGSGNYETLEANGGPSHVVVSSIFLGDSVDVDLGTGQNAAANADDVTSAINKDDEDGVLSPIDLFGTVGAAPTVTLLATNTSGSAATLHGWIDYNGNGVFENGTERASIAVPDSTTDGRFTLTFPAVPSGSAGNTYARFRLSTDAAAANSTGAATDGEVEDYQFEIIQPGATVLSYTKISDGLGGFTGPLDPLDIFGSGVANLGDVDGDGVTDIAVGAQLDENGDLSEGAAYVLFLNSNGTVKGQVKISDGIGGFGPNLLDANDVFGFPVGALGDLDGDGVPDLAVGAIGDDDNAVDEGAIYVLFLNSNGTVKQHVKIRDGLNGLNAPSLEANDHFGRSVWSLGDLDGDGVPDLGVGASGDENGDAGEGAIFLLLMNRDGTVKSNVRIGDGTTGGLTAGTLAAGDLFGEQVSTAGDIDKDGIADLVVSARGSDVGGTNTGATYVLLMNADLTVKSQHKIANGLGGIAANTFQANDIFGGLTTLGDLDGDGTPDLVANSDGDAASEGTVHILLMNTNATVERHYQLNDRDPGGLAPGALNGEEFFGSGVAPLGDLNGDGWMDIVVGALHDENVDASEGAIYIVNFGALDFGDAPDTGSGTGSGNYETTLANGGPSHFVDTRLFLGDSVEVDSGTLQNAEANADDVDEADDEDGVLSPLDLLATEGAAPTVTLLATNTSGSAATLHGWIDYNGNGVFENGTERASIAVPDSTTDGRFTLTFPAVPSGSAGKTYARFRLSTDAAAANSTGAASDGEVEDYVFTITEQTGTAASSVAKIAHGLGNGPTLVNEDHLGWSISAIGDLNQDGVTDLAVGADDDGTGGDDRGAVHIFFMNADGSVQSRAKIASGTANVPTLLDFDTFGTDVRGIGDLDGDGVHDLAVGAAGDDTGGNRRGAIHILFMNTDGSVKSSTTIENNTNGGPTLSNDVQFGNDNGGAIELLGDLDGDGVSDLAVGVGRDNTGGAARGAVYIFFMNPDGSIRSTQKLAHNLAGGPSLEDGDLFGSDVTALGDLDNDGITEIAVGAALDDDGGTNRGAVYVLFLNADGSVKSSSTQKISHNASGPSLADSELFGSSLTTPGDLDGDGVPDLVASGVDNGGTSKGKLHVLLLNADGTLKSASEIGDGVGNGPTLLAGDFFGSSITGVGDLNGDGRPDLAVGAPFDDTGGTNRGAVHVIFLGAAPDTVAPGTSSFTRQTPPAEVTNADTLTFLATFSEPVQNVDAADFAVTGTTGTIAVSQVTTSTYDVTISGGDLASLDGTVDLNLAASPSIQDLAGNALPNTQPSGVNDQTYTVDNTAPSTPAGAITSTESSPTSASPIPIRIDFSEPVLGFTLSDITVTNGTPQDFVDVGNGVFTINVVPTADGPVTVEVPAGVMTDLAGNPNTAGVPFSITADSTAPSSSSFTRKTPTDEFTNADSLTFLATFSEPVQNVDAADFAVSGTTGTIAVSQVTTSTYDVTISGGDLAALNGTVDLNLAASPTIQDLAGNALPNTQPTGANDQTYTVDNTAPSTPAGAITSTESSPTNASPIPIRIDFSEPVLGFTLSDITVTNGTPQDFVDVGNGVFTINVVPTADGPVTVEVPAGVMTDLAGNPNTAGAPFSITADSTAPSASSFTRKSPTSQHTNVDSLTFLATFSEDVTGVDNADFAVSGTTGTIAVTQVTASTYDIVISGGDLAGLNGTVGLNFASSPSITDVAGNALPTAEPSTDETYIVDNTSPSTASFTRKSPTDQNTAADTLTFLATFSEDVTGVDPADFTPTGTTATVSVSQVTPSTYDVTFTGGDLPALNGTVGLNFSGSPAITDLAGNQLPTAEPSTDETYTLDNSALSFARKTPTDEYTNADSLTFLVTFQPDVASVDAADFEVTGTTATVTTVTELTPKTFDVVVSGGDLAGLNATVGLNFASSASITDSGGGALTLLEPGIDETFVVDNTAPALPGGAITSTETDPTSANPIPIRIDFGEPVIGLTLDDLDVTNGTPQDLVDAGNGVFTVNVVPTSDGPITIDVPANAVTDRAGNPNTAAVPFTITSDRTAPGTSSFTRKTPTAEFTNADTLVFLATFDEAVTGVDPTDFAVTGTTGAIAVSQVTPNTYDVTVSGGDLTSLNGVVDLNLAGSPSITDLAGNALPSTQPTGTSDETYTVDNSAPTLGTGAITSTESSPTNASPIPIRVDFGEAVDGFELTDITFTNGTPQDLTDVGNGVFTFNVTPTADGPVTLDLPANVVTDRAGNPNTAGAPFTIVSDQTAPGPNDITSTAGNPTRTSPIPIRIDFGEPVDGFTLDDITFTNGTPQDLTDGGNGVFTLNVVPTDDGPVTLTIAANAVTDEAGNPNPAGNPFTITFDTVGPTVDIVDVSPDPTQSAATITVNFSEAVTGVDINDFALTFEGNAVDISGASLSGSGSSYTLDLTSVTGTQGRYDLTLSDSGTGIQDLAGNALTAGASDVWAFGFAGGTTSGQTGTVGDVGGDSDENLTLGVTSGATRLSDENNVLAAGNGTTQINDTTIEFDTTLDELTINAGDGDDRLVVDIRSGNPVPGGSLTFNGGDGDDELIVVDDDGATSVRGIYRPDGTRATDGTVSIDLNNGDVLTIRFTGLEPVETSGVPIFTFESANSSDAVDITATTGSGGEQALLVAGTSDSVAFESQTLFGATDFTIDLGTNDATNGDDTLTLTSGLDQTSDIATSLQDLTITTGSGDDTVNVNSVINLPGALSIDGALIQGTGSIVNPLTVQAGAVLSPGPGADQFPIGNLAFGSGGTFAPEVVSTSSFDQVQVTGSVNLTGARIRVDSSSAAVSIGDKFIVIANDGTDAITGTFTGIAETGMVESSGNFFRVSYVGGDGNDVELTAALPFIVAGHPRHVRQVDPITGVESTRVDPLDSNFAQSVRVAAGDFNNDGIDDMVVGAGPGGAPVVQVFSGADGSRLMDFSAYRSDFRGGVYVATGDFNGDGMPDIVTGAGEKGGPHVQVFDGQTRQRLHSFFAFESEFRGGVRVAAGDADGDGDTDIITAAGPGRAPEVRVFDGTTGAQQGDTISAYSAFTGGVYVSAGDVNGDGDVDILTGAGANGGPHVRVFDGSDHSELASFFAYDKQFRGGIRVAAADVNSDGLADILVNPADNSSAPVGFDANGFTRLTTGFAIADLGPGFYAVAPTMRSPQTNLPPRVINPIPDQVATSDTVFSYTIPDSTFRDPNPTDQLAISTGTLPSWLTYNAPTRTLTGTPSTGDAGNVDIQVTATDGTNSVSDTFSLTVRTPTTTTVSGQLALGAGPGQSPFVRIVNASTGEVATTILAYDAGFKGGVDVALGDVTGDGVDDVITGPGAGGGPHIKVFNGDTGEVVHSFFAHSKSYAGGVRVAAGDVNGDGRDDIIVGMGPGLDVLAKVFDGSTGEILHSLSRQFVDYNVGFAGGVDVASGDVNADGIDDIITSADRAGGSHIMSFHGQTLERLDNLFAFRSDTSYAADIDVVAGDLDGDGRAEIVASSGGGRRAEIQVFAGNTGPQVDLESDPLPLRILAPFGDNVNSGVRIALTDANGDGALDLATTPSDGASTNVSSFDGRDLAPIGEFSAIDAAFSSGVLLD